MEVSLTTQINILNFPDVFRNYFYSLKWRKCQKKDRTTLNETFYQEQFVIPSFLGILKELPIWKMKKKKRNFSKISGPINQPKFHSA